VGAYSGRVIDPPFDVHPKMNAEPTRDLLGLLHHSPRYHPRARVSRDHVEGGPAERGDRVEAEISPQLEPNVIQVAGRFWYSAFPCLPLHHPPVRTKSGGRAGAVTVRCKAAMIGTPTSVRRAAR
jgi:hypothetical protein